MIEIRDVSGGYDRRLVTDGVSLTFADGRITGIIGPNGCGKSTLLKLAAGHLPAWSGQVLLDGRPLKRDEAARSVSYFAQRYPTPDLTVESLVLYGRYPWLTFPYLYGAQDHALAERAMKCTGVLAMRGRLVNTLSGGERQKAFLAMILAQDTKTILLDEPTTFLDIGHQLELVELLAGLKAQGRAVVMVLHDLSLACEAADELVLLHSGKAAAVGFPLQVLESEAFEQAFGVKARQGTRIGFERMRQVL